MRLLGRLLAPEDRGLCVIEVAAGLVTEITPSASHTRCDAGGPDALIVPGLVDLQLNGAFWVDFSNPDADLALAAAGLPSTGVTAFLPTVITSSPDRTEACIRNLSRAPAEPGARALGIHLEGPFLSPARAGTHDGALLRLPSVDEARAWLAADAIRLVTLAPELPGAIDLIRELCERGVLVALGHSEATWEETDAAIAAGARLGTHLFNAMRPLDHREPGIVGRLLGPSVAASLIADGVHVAPTVVRLVADLKGPDLLVLVTDGLAALGLPAGRYPLAGREVISDGIVARLEDGTISGSVGPMATALGRLVADGLDPVTTVRAASSNPARLLGVEDRHGRIEAGRVADLVLLDAGWQPKLTLAGGRVAYDAT